MYYNIKTENNNIEEAYNLIKGNGRIKLYISFFHPRPPASSLPACGRAPSSTCEGAYGYKTIHVILNSNMQR